MVGLGAAAQEQFAAVGGGDDHVEQLQAGELLEDDARHQAGGQRAELLAQGDGQAVRQEGDKEVGLDAGGLVMEDRTQPEIALERAEGFLDVAQLHVAAPDQRGIVGSQVGAQQVAAFAAAGAAQGGAIELVAQDARVADLDLH